MSHFNGMFGNLGGYSFGAVDPRVQLAQSLLNLLGIKDAQGNVLVEDGIWGASTNAAFAKFYKAIGRPQPSALTETVIRQLQAVLDKGWQVFLHGEGSTPKPGDAPLPNEDEPKAPSSFPTGGFIIFALAFAALISARTPRE